MATLSEHHKPKCGVEGKCSVPMWMGGLPSGFCDRPAFGEQYAKNSRYAPPHWGPWERKGFLMPGGRSAPYAPGYCCDRHGGPSADQNRFVRDGNMWCAFMPGFVNLQESIAGFGETQAAAERNLMSLTAPSTHTESGIRDSISEGDASRELKA